MVDISIRGDLWDDDSADVLRWWGFRDIVAPMDIQAALEEAGGEDVTVLVNSPGGDMTVGGEIRSMLRRYRGKTTALFQGYGASAATLAVSGCTVIQSEPGALLCYHNPVAGAQGDYRDMKRSAQALKNARDCILERSTQPGGADGADGPEYLDHPHPGQGVWPDRRDRGAGWRRGGGGPGGLCGGGREPLPADSRHAAAVSGPHGGGADRRGAEETGRLHPGQAAGAE